jgi:hypothetical protein
MSIHKLIRQMWRPCLGWMRSRGIISRLRSNDIYGHTNPQPLTAIATGDMWPVNYWPHIGHEQYSLPVIDQKTDNNC